MSLRGTKQTQQSQPEAGLKQRPNYFPALTGVRAMAAYLVFVSHYDYKFDTTYPTVIQRYLHEFHIGVTIFFVLSGFLITYRYHDNFRIEKAWFKKYIRNRFARIYPMFFIFTVGAFTYYYFTGFEGALSGKNHPLTLLIVNLLLLKGLFNTIIFSGVGTAWSLTVEEVFYASAPLIFYINKRYRLFFVQVAIITAFGFLMVAIFRHANFYGFFANNTFMMIYTFFGRCFEFFVGVRLALHLLKRPIENRQGAKATYGGLIGIFICPFLMSLLPIPPEWKAGLHNPIGIVINNYILPIAIATFFYGLITEESRLKRIFALPFADLLGRSSYIFYLIHISLISMGVQWGLDNLNDLVFGLYDKAGLDWHSPFEYDGLNILYLFIIINIISIILFKFVEDPLNRFFRKPFLPKVKTDGEFSK